MSGTKNQCHYFAIRSQKLWSKFQCFILLNYNTLNRMLPAVSRRIKTITGSCGVRFFQIQYLLCVKQKAAIFVICLSFFIYPATRRRRSSSQAATSAPVYYTRCRLHTVPFKAEHQAGRLLIPIYLVFDLIRPGIELGSTVLVAHAINPRTLIALKQTVQ